MNHDQSGNQGYITGSVVSLHAGPSEDAEVVTQAKMGETFRVIEEAAGWWRVALDYDGYPGYMPASAGRLVRTTPGVPDMPSVPSVPGEPGVPGVPGIPAAASEMDFRAQPAVVRNLFGNVYSGPTIKSRLLVTLPIGVKVRLHPETRATDQAKEWLAVSLPNGMQGFMHTGDLTTNGQEWAWTTGAELRANLVRTARRFLGIPYRWGGTSSFGVDCSGFVQLLYRLHGLFLPRDAHEQGQYEKTFPINRTDLVPGDLIFFNNYGHVGMAISHFEFIHATTRGSPVVQISDVDDPYYSQERCDIRRYRL